MNNEFYLADAIDVIEEILNSGGEFRLQPKGTSMLPLIVQGEDSVVLRKYSTEPRKKDIAFYRRRNGQFVLHRILKIEKDGTYTMCGDSQTVLEKGICKDQIIGYVSEIYKGDTKLNTNSFKYKLYLFFWCFMPYRKTERFVYRCIGKTVRFFHKKG